MKYVFLHVIFIRHEHIQNIFREEEELSILSHEQQLFALITYFYGYILVLRMFRRF